MENILGVGSITIADLNDALISGDAPRNPDEGALWIDSSANTPVLKVYKNGSWQPQEIDVNNLDPELSETVTTIVNTLGTLANDGLLTYTDRLQLSVEIASIIGQIPSKQNGNVYPNTLPAYNIIDSLGVGSFSNLRQTARDATVPTDNTYYITLERAYTALNTYLSSLTPRPWDVTTTNKDKNTEVANPDTYRETLLNYYLAEMNLATYTEKRASDAAKEYTDASVQDAITSVDVEYATSTESNTVPDDDKWDTLAPTWSDGIFIWSRTLTTYKNGTTIISEPVNITGAKGESGGTGAAGRSITKIQEQYYVSDSATERIGGEWENEYPGWEEGKFVWTRSVITFTNPSGTHTTDPISVSGAKGDKGDPGANAPTIKLSGASQMIKQDALGNVTPSESFNVIGVTVNTSITRWLFSVNGGAFGTVLPTGVTRSGNVVTVNPNDVTFNTLSIRAEDGTVTDTFTIGRAVDGEKGAKGDKGDEGADAYTVLLSNESHTFQAGTTNAVAGSTTTDIHAYKGTQRIPVSVGSITGVPSGMNNPSISNNNSINARITFSVTTAMTSPNGSITINLTVDGKPMVKVFSYSLTFKGVKGDTGDEGPQGPQGKEGPKGADGQSQYTHIRYSANANGSSMTTTPVSTTKYIGIAVTNSATAPAYTGFTWSKYVGENGSQGPQGIRGPAGANGQPTYTWVKYAEDKNGGGMSDYPEGKRFIGLAFNKTTQTESTTPSHYQWSEMPQNIEVGGSNHLRNTGVGNSESILMFGHPMLGPSFSLSAGAEYYTLESKVSSGEAYYRAMAQGTIPSELSGTWTFSGKVLIPEDTSGIPVTRTQIAITSPSGWVNSYGNGERPINATKGIWTKFVHTFEMPEGTQSLHLGIRFVHNTQEVGDKIHFKNFKLERGNIATDWTEAPEDTQAKIDEKAGSEYVSTTLKYYNAGIVEEIDKIVGTVQEDTVTKTEFGTYQQSLETKFTQDAKSYTMDFNNVTSSVQTLEGAVQEEFDEVKKYIRFIDGKIILGEVGNQITLEISKEKISFLQGEDEVAKLTNNELEITDARIKHELRIGDYAFKPRANGSVDFG